MLQLRLIERENKSKMCSLIQLYLNIYNLVITYIQRIKLIALEGNLNTQMYLTLSNLQYCK